MKSPTSRVFSLALASSMAALADAQQYFMIFGDSYTQTGFNIGGTQPSAANPLGNPALPGSTTSGGLNWVGYAATELNSTATLAYNFAQGGATTDADIVAPYDSSIVCFDDQVDLFQANVAVDGGAWTADDDTLVAVWVGINDVGQDFWSGVVAPVEEIMDRYFGLLQTLYEDGVRTFVLFSVPPIDKSPIMLSQASDRLATLRSTIDSYNAALESRLASFVSANSGAAGHVLDTAPSFETAIADPTAYGAADATCYDSDGTSCLWWDNYHPGVAIHELVAEAFTASLA